MVSYCLKWRRNLESQNSKVARTKNGRTMLFSKFLVCDKKKSKFIKQQETSGLIISLEIETLLIKMP